MQRPVMTMGRTTAALLHVLSFRLLILTICILRPAHAATTAWPDIVFNDFPKPSWDGNMWWICALWGLSGEIAGDSLILDSGLYQMAYTSNPGRSNENLTVTHRPNNFLHLIDLSVSWATTDVRITSLPKPAPLTVDFVTHNALFSDMGRVSAVGGTSIITRGNFPISSWLMGPEELPDTKNNSLWYFDNASHTFFPDGKILMRPVEPGYASDYANRKGYTFGGVERAQGARVGLGEGYSPTREVQQSTLDPVTGVVFTKDFRYSTNLYEYDVIKQTVTTLNEGNPRVIIPRVGHALVHIPVATKGLLMSLGGRGIVGGANPMVNISFATIDIFDVDTASWLKQTASGNPPPDGIPVCTVLAELPTTASSANQEFLLYVFGHALTSTPGSATTIWTLHLPSFHWTALPSSTSASDTGDRFTVPPARDTPVCKLAGNRHMLLVGGRALKAEACTNPDVKDPFRDKASKFLNPYPFGINTFVYDLVKLRWTDWYDAHAAKYVVPDDVTKDLPTGSARATPSAGWGDSVLRDRFLGNSSGTDDGGNGTTGRKKGNTTSTGLSAGAIAGLVIGPMAFCAVIAVLIWLGCIMGWCAMPERPNTEIITGLSSPAAELDAGCVPSSHRIQRPATATLVEFPPGRKSQEMVMSPAHVGTRR